MFTLWNPVTNTFDEDWHHTEAQALAHKIRCGLNDDWHVAQLSTEQQDVIYDQHKEMRS